MPTKFRSHVLKASFSDFLRETLQFKAAVSQSRTFHIDLHPSTHVQLKKSNGRCLGYDVSECHANFQTNMKSFAHRNRQKKNTC